jgi:hypothetical protein
MSIRAAIRRHVLGDRLRPLEMTLRSDEVSRSLFLAPDLWPLMDGPWTSPQCAGRVARLQADLESFVTGGAVGICLDAFRAEDAFFGRLDTVEERVWDIRCRGPKPGLRIVGHFAECDTFIAMTWAPRSKSWNGREPLGDRFSSAWSRIKSTSRSEWIRLFPQHEPIHGGAVQDYVSKNSFPV